MSTSTFDAARQQSWSQPPPPNLGCKSRLSIPFDRDVEGTEQKCPFRLKTILLLPSSASLCGRTSPSNYTRFKGKVKELQLSRHDASGHMLSSCRAARHAPSSISRRIGEPGDFDTVFGYGTCGLTSKRCWMCVSSNVQLRGLNDTPLSDLCSRSLSHVARACLVSKGLRGQDRVAQVRVLFMECGPL